MILLIMMTTRSSEEYKRNGKRWTTTELLKLQREYELLGLSVEQIAKNHKRSVCSIIYKLQGEGFLLSEDESPVRHYFTRSSTH
ncbi:MAG: hypothetical protein CMC04_08675 [Flavobacteriaceae bacterium]|nr:hypothetical protein [Flavobacteriaceae bacterium]